MFAVITQSLALKHPILLKKASACNFEALHRSVKNSEQNGQPPILNKTQLACISKMTQIKKKW